MIINHSTYITPLGELHYHYYTHPSISNSDRKLLLLHGSRLGGLETWNRIAKQLSSWPHILIPELPGVGALNPINQTDSDFTLAEIINALHILLKQHNWNQIDIASYSFGGVVSMFLSQRFPPLVMHQYLIEASLLNANYTHYPVMAVKMMEIANLMCKTPLKGNEKFSQLITPKSRQFSLKMNTRPINNPLGFANILRILADIFSKNNDVENLLSAQKATSVLITEFARKEAKQMIQHVTKTYGWPVYSVEQADHSLLFLYPDKVANLLESWFDKTNGNPNDE